MLATGLRLAPEAMPTAAYLGVVGAGFAVLASTNNQAGVRSSWYRLAAGWF